MSRPAKYRTPEEMEAACEGYFRGCREDGAIPTSAGLAWELGFESRQSLRDYKGRAGFERNVIQIRPPSRAYTE